MEIKEIKIEDEKYPNQLKEIKNPPNKIFLVGNEKILQSDGIAVIGSRCNTEYGEKYATKFSKELAKQGLTIISGMAVGIDGFAHKGALSVGGKTIAVLGSGFNNIYPEENKELFKQIIENDGAIITEYEPDVKPNSENFPKRNRIVSGLSKGVLVIEAVYRSGTSITAKLGQSQGRKVFCIPSNLERKNGVGTNQLIKEGASLVTNIDDILNAIKVERKAENNAVKIPAEYLPIYEVLEDEPMNVNVICKKLKTDISSINANLMLMELEGYIKSLPGNYYEKAEL